jgi:glucose/arabinose dehydrogenase
MRSTICALGFARGLAMGLSAACAVSLVSGLASSVHAQDYANVTTVIGSGLSAPVGLYAIPGDDTRMVVVQQGGQIRLVNVTTDSVTGNRTYALGSTLLDFAALDAANPFFRDAGGNVLRDQTNTVVPRIIRSGGTALSSGGFSWAVVRGGEQGLLGLAFAPDFQTSGKFYVNYVQNNPNMTTGAITWGLSGNGTTTPRQASTTGRTAIVEFQVDNPANPTGIIQSSEKVIITINQTFTNHNGGCVAFGPDGKLYVGMGDGGSGNDPNNDALDPNELLGKLLRLDVSGGDDFPADPLRNYVIPSDNPFANGVGGRGEWWARGLRNPWRFSFDKFNGDLWIGDVGQDRWEEINRVVGIGAPGLNYGWRFREGFIRPPSLTSDAAAAGAFDVSSLTNPVYVWPHLTTTGWASNQLAGSGVGGVVYNGTAIRPWRGKYFLSDTVTNGVWSMNSRAVAPNGTPAEVGLETLTTSLRTTIGGVTPPAFSNVVSFAEDNDGEVFIVEIVGRIRKIVPQGTMPAIADLGAQGGIVGIDGVLDNNDFAAFIDLFFNNDRRADVGEQGGLIGSDNVLDNNDFAAFITAFFGG